MDLYTVKTKDAQLELTAVLLNINRNHNRELKLIPAYRHDILHDSCIRQVWEYIWKWMEEKYKRGGE